MMKKEKSSTEGAKRGEELTRKEFDPNAVHTPSVKVIETAVPLQSTEE